MSLAPSASAASTAQFPQLPLQRDAERADAGASFAWVGVVLMVAVAAVLVWKRRAVFAARAGAPLTAQPVRALTAQASLHVVEWEGERLLVACTPHSVSVLARRPAGPESAS